MPPTDENRRPLPKYIVGTLPLRACSTGLLSGLHWPCHFLLGHWLDN